MKKITSFVLNRVSKFALLSTFGFGALIPACASDPNQIMGRPPGIQTSAEDAKRKKGVQDGATENKKRKEVKATSHFDDNTLVNWDEDVAWSEDEDLKVWNSEDREYSPIFEIEGWPYQESGSSFRVLWRGAPGKVQLYKKPSLKAPSGKELSFDRDEEIGWVSTHVAVLSPSIYTLKEDKLLEGFDIFSEGFLSGTDGFSKQMKKGSKLRVLLYAGDGLCYVGIVGKSVETLCPDPESYRGSFRGRDLREQMQPASRMWWIELEGNQGWIALDNKYIVEIR